MRLFINATSARTGGGVTHLTWLLHGLAKIGSELEILVLTTSSPPERLTGLPPTFRVYPHPADTWPLARRLIWEQTQLPRMIKRWGADTYLSFGSFGLLHSPCPQVMICAQPLYFSERYYKEFAVKNRRLLLEEIGRRALLKATARRANRILTQTDAMRRQIVLQLGVPAERISVIPHGIHGSFLTDDEGRTTEDQHPESALPSSVDRHPSSAQRSVLYVSVHQVHKDFDTLVRAAAIMRRQEPSDLRFLFTGNPNDNQFSRATGDLVRELGLEETVHFVGLVPNDQIHSLYRSADVFAFPSWAETFGIPLVEAMACGLPIVAADIEVNREVAADAAVYHTVSDPAPLASQLNRLLTDSALRTRLATVGR
ncbi:MAG TPA: glycosyltransferase family 1 protein, partial [Chloroflexota bacterium]|nr:glycosyltransferase family 1 protein [Chloroflexota bacterium]